MTIEKFAKRKGHRQKKRPNLNAAGYKGVQLSACCFAWPEMTSNRKPIDRPGDIGR